MFLRFLPVCLGTWSEWRMLPNPASAFYGGQQEFQSLILREQASDKNEIVVVVPLKAEGAPVPGAGFTPEAVPGNSAEMKNTRTLSHFDESRLNVVSNGTQQKNAFKRNI